jgi:hypothetical protein
LNPPARRAQERNEQREVPARLSVAWAFLLPVGALPRVAHFCALRKSGAFSNSFLPVHGTVSRNEEGSMQRIGAVAADGWAFWPAVYLAVNTR